jgi:hypothetical protein
MSSPGLFDVVDSPKQSSIQFKPVAHHFRVRINGATDSLGDGLNGVLAPRRCGECVIIRHACLLQCQFFGSGTDGSMGHVERRTEDGCV